MPEALQLDATEGTFEHDALHPGRWKLESTGDFYVVEPPTVEVSAGGMTEIEVRLSSEWSALRGAIRLRDGERLAAASHFTVGVRGEGLRRGMQTDDQWPFRVREADARRLRDRRLEPAERSTFKTRPPGARSSRAHQEGHAGTGLRNGGRLDGDPARSEGAR
jgi:hypothetical protein